MPVELSMRSRSISGDLHLYINFMMYILTKDELHCNLKVFNVGWTVFYLSSSTFQSIEISAKPPYLI